MSDPVSPRAVSPARVLVLLAFLRLVAGCAGAQRTGARASEFPSRQELAAALQRPAPEPSRASDVPRVDVEAWALQSPLPDTLGDTDANAEAAPSQVLRDVLRERGDAVRVTDAMSCAAHELARFLLAHGGAPPEDLQWFIEGRCGALSGHVGFSHVGRDAPPDRADEDLLAELRESQGDALRRMFREGRFVAGAALARAGGRYELVVTRAARAVELETASQLPDANGDVTLVGTAHGAAGELHALVTRGAHGVVDCALDDTVRAPRFRITCPVERADGVARVAVMVRRAGRVLSDPLFSVLVRADGAAHDAWRRPPHPERPLAASPEAVTAQMLALINERRREAGHGPVTLAEAQSRTACRVAPWYFAASRGQADARTADVMALGLLAGWEVEGTVREGDLGAMSNVPTRDLGAWMAAASQMPLARRTLLGAEAAQVALCPRLDDEGRLRDVLWASYAMLDASRADEEARVAHARIMRARREYGTPTAPVDEALTAIARRFARRIEAGEFETLEAALDAMLTEATSATGQGAAGAINSPYTVETMQVSDNLLRGSPVMGVALAYRREPGRPWGERLVLVLRRSY